MKINACFEVVVEMEVDDKFEILTTEPVKELMDELLEESDSPIDKGKDIFEKLLWNKRKYNLI